MCNHYSFLAKAFGAFEGKTKDYVNKVIRQHNSTPAEFVAEGGESWPQVMERMVDFFDELCKKMLAENASTKSTSKEESVNACESSATSPYVLMVCHGGAIRQLLFHMSRNIASEFNGTRKTDIGKLCPNTGVSNMEVYVGRESGRAEFLKCTMLYDGSHLVVEEEKILYEDHAL